MTKLELNSNSKEFGIKIQEAVDKLGLVPLTEGERNFIFCIRGIDDNWYSFADILNEIVKRIV